MPMKKSNYPKNWLSIRQEILVRAGNQCECRGECGVVDHFLPRCQERDKTPALHFRGRVILTTAHLNQNTRYNRRINLKAMCQACHLRYDNASNIIKAIVTKDRKRGQLRLGLSEVYA